MDGLEHRDDEMAERHARGLYAAVRDGAIIAHLRLVPDALLDAVIDRVRALAREDGVRLVVKRDTEDGRVRYRLRRRREGE